VAEVVAVHGDVERADAVTAGAAAGGVPAGPLGLDAGEDAVEPLRQDRTAGRDAEQDEVRGSVVGLEELVGDACQRTRDVGLLQDRSGAHADLLPRLSGRH
jgi:hypothetical protein